MFADQVPSSHEKDMHRLIGLILDDGLGSPALRRFLRIRDRWRGLQIDALHVNVFLIDNLMSPLLDSRYLLTVRSPAQWLRSFLDDSLRQDHAPIWHRFRNFRFGPKAVAEGPEAARGTAGLYTLDGYLKYWMLSITEVMAKVPKDRLLVLQTEDIATRTTEIAHFVQVPDPDRPPRTTYAYRKTQRFGLLDQTPREHLAARLEAVSGLTARAILPDWTVQKDMEAVLRPTATTGV